MNLSQSLKMRLLAKRQRGVTMIEYALIAALIAVAAVAVLTLLGPEIAATFTTVTTEMQNVNK
jgi:pilus assembly protein Flp/PilA